MLVGQELHHAGYACSLTAARLLFSNSSHAIVTTARLLLLLLQPPHCCCCHCCPLLKIAAAQVVNLQPPDAPADRPDPSYDWDVPHTPCYWDKQASKSSPSVSCARSGEVVATGKYGIILVGQQNKPVQAVPDGNGKLAAAAFEWPMYEGSMPGAPTV